ncbi:MAG: DegT/DnrJ/EryC1/StrS family aminotransferase [bacterium]|nr:DegT/DnrJ/EryC1/StrS family aminotransferase [bacterium]
MFIPFHIPTIGKKEFQAVNQALKVGWITTGPTSLRFEQLICRELGAKHAVALNSGTAGLHLSLVALGVKPGDEVIVPTYTFSATAAVVVHCGAKPVLVDVDKERMLILPQEIERKITKKTKAIIPVHLAGHPYPMQEVQQLANQYRLAVIDDAAHAFGAEYRGRKIGSFETIAVFSFHSTKPISTGEGGVLTTTLQSLAEHIRRLSLHGLSNGAWNRYRKEGSWFYQVLEAGYKYNLPDIPAALGIAQLQQATRWHKIRTKYAQLYTAGFAENEAVETPTVAPDIISSWHLYIIKLNLEQLRISRNQLIELLRKKGIGTSVHYIPLHHHPYYQRVWGYKPSEFPNANWAYERVISLPLYPNLKQNQVEYIINSINKLSKKYKR